MSEGERGRFVTLVACVLWLVLLGESQAQTLLRWNLKPGQAFSLHTQQQTDSQVAFGAKSAKTQIEDEVYLAWSVVAADEGAITIKQTIERIVVKMIAPDAGAIEFDSASSARSTGQAQSLASSLKPLVGAEVEIKMSPRGEVLDVRPLNDAAKALFDSSDKAAETAIASRSSLQQVLRQPLVVLPESEIKQDDIWKSTAELSTAAGTMTKETDYQLTDFAEQDGKAIAQIAATSKLIPQPGTRSAERPDSRIRIESQVQSATIHFSVTDGRLLQVDQAQKLVTHRPYRETTIIVTLNSTQKTTFTPQP